MKKKMECFIEWCLFGGGLILVSVISLVESYYIPEEQWGWIVFCALLSLCFTPIGMFCFIEGLVKHIKLILKEEKEGEKISK